ncbi:hypothetical protein IIA15_08675, partial [candidate division TA06 bacterium]|nr:hypothetical protein [candidate division TA06 bacterium]
MKKLFIVLGLVSIMVAGAALYAAKADKDTANPGMAVTSIFNEDWAQDERSMALTTEGLDEFLPKTIMPEPVKTLSPDYGDLLGSWTWSEIGISGNGFDGAGLTYNGEFLYLPNQFNNRIYVVDPTVEPPVAVGFCSPTFTGLTPWSIWNVEGDAHPLGFGDATLFTNDVFRQMDDTYPAADWCSEHCNFTPITGGSFEADGTENLDEGGDFYVLTVAAGNGIKKYNRSGGCITGPLETIVNSEWAFISQRALSYNPDDNAFYVGGWNVDKMWEITRTGEVIPGRDFPADNPSGAAYDNVNTSGGEPILWVQSNT